MKLRLTSKIPVYQRLDKAKEIIQTATVTSEIEKVIDGTIETELPALEQKTPLHKHRK